MSSSTSSSTAFRCLALTSLASLLAAPGSPQTCNTTCIGAPGLPVELMAFEIERDDRSSSGYHLGSTRSRGRSDGSTNRSSSRRGIDHLHWKAVEPAGSGHRFRK